MFNHQRSTIFNTVLALLFIALAGVGYAQTSDDEIMQILLEESKTEAAGVLENNPNLRSVEVEAIDGILIYHYTFKEGLLTSPSQDEIDLMKKSLISTLKVSFIAFLANEESEDEEDITSEELFEHLKGFRFLYIEENTLKGFQIDITTEEIRNAKPIAIPADEITQEKLLEQMSAEQYANDIAKSSRELCPMVSAEIITDSMVYDYKNLHFYCRIDSIEQLVGDIAAIKEGIRNQMVFAGNVSNIFMKLAELDGGWYLYYKVQNADTTVTVYFTPEEMKEMIGSGDTLNDVDRARHALNAIIKTTNAQMPMLLDFMTRLDSLYIDGNNLVYHNTILDQFETLKENTTTLRWVLQSQFTSEDTSVQYLLLMCIRSGYGLCYRYEPLPADKKPKKKSKKQKGNDRLDICFSVEELEGYVKE